MSELFDEIAKTLAKPMSRRRALGTVAGLVGGAAFGAFRPGRAQASGLCGTNGNTFPCGSLPGGGPQCCDPSHEFCCTGTGPPPQNQTCCAQPTFCCPLADGTVQCCPAGTTCDPHTGCVSNCPPGLNPCTANGVQICCPDSTCCTDPATGNPICCPDNMVCNPAAGGCTCPSGTTPCGSPPNDCCGPDEVCDPSTGGCVLAPGKKCKAPKTPCTGGGKTKCCKPNRKCCVFTDASGKTKLKCCKPGETCDPKRGCVKP